MNEASADPLFSHDWETLIVSRNGPVVEIELHRPEARNALDARLMRELTDAATLLRRRSDVLAVLLCGAETYFSAGADLEQMEAWIRAQTVLETREAIMAGPDLCRAWEQIEAVTIAAIEGYCIGGGCALSLACDFRILGEGAYLRLPEVPLGLNMSWNSVPRVTTLVGPARAKRFVIFGEATDSATCVAWGLADELTARGEARRTAREWAQRICALPPLPVRMTKEAINAQAAMAHFSTSFMDRDQYLVTSRTNDFREGVQAFLEKRAPQFRGD